MSVYVDDFLLASNTMSALNVLKESISKKHNAKNLDEVKTIIGWQITRNPATQTMKIDKSAFI